MKDKDLIAKINKRYEQAAEAQAAVLEEFEQARLFYRGDQWINRVGGTWTSTAIPRWRVRLTVNKLIPMVDLLVSTVAGRRPIITARPRTDEQQDRRAAKIGERLCRYYWDMIDLDVELIRILKYVFVEGNVFGFPTWDKQANMPRLNIVPPYSFSVEPGATRLEDAGWSMVTRYARIDDLEIQYNQKVEKVLPDEANYRQFMPVLADNENMDLEGRTLYQHYFERPSREFPEGRYVIRAGNAVVADKPLPIRGPWGPDFPIVHMQAIELLDEFWGTSPISQAIPLQMEINRSRSQLVENRNLTGRPQMIAPQGAIEEDSYTNEPGSIVWWDPVLGRGHEPHYMNPPVIPGWVQSIMAMAEQDMYDLVGRHEVSQGQLTANVTSGRQAAILRQSDDSRWAPTIRTVQHSLKKLGRMLLQLAKQNLTGEQVINIAGRGRESEVFAFMAEDIDAGVNLQFDIESQLPWTKESSRQLAVQLHSQGLLDTETLQQIMEVPSPDRLYEPKVEHVQNARNENRMLEDEYFDPVPTDDHEVHIREHARYVNNPDLRHAIIQQYKLDKMRAQLTGEQPPPVPSIIANVLRHMEEHRQKLPKPEPPPPAPKVNLGLDRLIRDLLKINPEAAAQLLPYVQEILNDTINSQTPKEAPEPQAPSAPVRAPMEDYGGQPTQEQIGPMPEEVT